jgi:hypothetical protein
MESGTFGIGRHQALAGGRGRRHVPSDICHLADVPAESLCNLQSTRTKSAEPQTDRRKTKEDVQVGSTNLRRLSRPKMFGDY